MRDRFYTRFTPRTKSSKINIYSPQNLACKILINFTLIKILQDFFNKTYLKPLFKENLNATSLHATHTPRKSRNHTKSKSFFF
ncbi:hypothetical protein [Helicobacter sp. T3_23-1059]